MSRRQPIGSEHASGPKPPPPPGPPATGQLVDRPSEFREWAILELMGHRRLAGEVSEAEIGGAKFIRIDVPNGKIYSTQFYSPGAVYCITPTSEETARQFAEATQPAPISKWDLPQLRAARDDE